MTRRAKPPRWFPWAIWAAIFAAIALPTAYMLIDGTAPTHADGN